jgi:type III pantothenate kinase
MKLLFDVGNTRLKIAVLEADSLRFIAALPTEDESLLRQSLAMQMSALGAIEQALGVCVGRGVVAEIVQSVLPPKVALQWVRPTTRAAGVTNAYPEPEQLGADRWVGVIGLTRHFQFDQAIPGRASVVLANFGTATTVDTLGADKVFRGGLILPGVAMMHASLASGTARLPQALGAVVDNPVNTTSAIASGVVAAQIGAVKRQLEIAQRDDGQAPILCVSGGAYERVQAALQQSLRDFTIHHLPMVVLDGLAVLAQAPNSKRLH